MFGTKHWAGITGICMLLGIPAGAGAAEEVNIYVTRRPSLMQPVLQRFTEQTGIRTNLMFLPRGLVERVEAEGQNSPADVYLGASLDRLIEAKAAGITQPAGDNALEKAIPEPNRDSDGNWFALSKRAVVIVARSAAAADKTMAYDDLADPRWKGRVCILSGQHDDNIGLFSSILSELGPERTKAWLQGLVANQAAKPDAGARYASSADLLAGHCDLALGNSQDAGLMLQGESKPAAATLLKVLTPSKKAGGPYVDVTGMALAKYSPNKENALKLMRFLTSPEGQSLLARSLHETPVAGRVAGKAKSLVPLDKTKPDAAMVTQYRKAAAELADQTGFDDSDTDE